ncbi:ghrelin O-acyltransferase [Rhinatrema bivittatum]|uniref:ghrelin O-acyltransferase n=1 Tax=Rhinatrema bivittatum TaxID=194408 RepID=UPI001126A1D6|nr:ghrelin O-acyltransferase [Rhinatrema bivittatum]
MPASFIYTVYPYRPLFIHHVTSFHYKNGYEIVRINHYNYLVIDCFSGLSSTKIPMDWVALFCLHPMAVYQITAFPFAILFSLLCFFGYLSVNARYIFLLLGGLALAFAAMGPYSLLVIIPAYCSVILFHSVGPESVHSWTFFFQMSWQTLCHLWLHYKAYYLQELASVRLSFAISSLMLLTQRVTSLALDIHEGKVKGNAADSTLPGFSLRLPSYTAMPFFTYLLFFPSLLGGPLCSFARFQSKIQQMSTHRTLIPLWVAGQSCLLAIALHFFKALVKGSLGVLTDFTSCTGFGCIYTMWTTTLVFKLVYYSQWLLDESLFMVAGFVSEDGQENEEFLRDLSGTDLWTLETTNRMSLFTRTWNKSTSQWLRRLVFQHSGHHPLLKTFAFSAWWHGLHPGQIFGFLCWALMVEADYRIHPYYSSLVKSCHCWWLYKVFSWIQTQLIIAYIMSAIEMRHMPSLWKLCVSYGSFFPLLYCVSLLFLTKKKSRR